MDNGPWAHPDYEALLAFADRDPSAEEPLAMERHLAECADCRSRLEALAGTLAAYQRYHETVLLAALPAPPKPWGAPRWSELAGEAPREDPGRARAVAMPKRRPIPIRQWLAVAAAVILAVLVVRRFEHAPGVGAAELLRKAEAASQASPQPARRIRIRSRKHTWTRTARLEASAKPKSDDAAAIRALFDAAGYSWEDPLSASAFARWRSHLADKQDQVRREAAAYIVTTSTAEGALSQASLTLSAPDLRPVSGTLRFHSDEVIDRAEVPEPTRAAVPAPTG